jgi:HAMP domain-containing protein
VAVGRRRADHDVGAAGVAAEQGCEGGQGGHEQGRPLAAAEVPDLDREIGRQRQQLDRAAEAPARRARVVGGEVERGGHPGEL